MLCFHWAQPALRLLLCRNLCHLAFNQPNLHRASTCTTTLVCWDSLSAIITPQSLMCRAWMYACKEWWCQSQDANYKLYTYYILHSYNNLWLRWLKLYEACELLDSGATWYTLLAPLYTQHTLYCRMYLTVIALLCLLICLTRKLYSWLLQSLKILLLFQHFISPTYSPTFRKNCPLFQ